MLKRKALSLLLVIATCVSLLSIPFVSNAATPIKVACIGDSITAGVGTSNSSIYSYPAQLQNLLGNGYIVNNYGVSGRTMLKKGDYPYWNESYYTDSSNWQPNIVIIQLGTNDSKSWNWQYKSEFVSNYVEMINHYKSLASAPQVYAALCPTVYGNGTNWTDVDTVTGNTLNITDRAVTKFTARYVRLYITNSGIDNGARIYEFEVSNTSVPPATLLSSGFEMNQQQPTWKDTIEASINVSGYMTGVNPECSIRNNEISYSGLAAIMFSGTDNSATQSYCYSKVFDVNIPITSTTKLSYWFYPQQENGRHVAIDFICTDGTTLRDSGVVDQNGISIHPAVGRGTINAWNYIECNLGSKLNGKTIDRVNIGYDYPASTGQYRGYIDDISIMN